MLSKKIEAAALVLLIVMTGTLHASEGQDAKARKRDLIAQLFKVMDAKHLAQNTFDGLLNKMIDGPPGSEERIRDMPESDRAAYEEQLRKTQEQMRVFRERLFARVDFEKVAESAYGPIFDRTFNEDELLELIAFYKTKTGQKHVSVMADMTMAAFMSGSEMLSKEMQQVAAEMQSEDNAKHPARKAMSDLRTMATAVEAYATDENKYPEASSMDELAKFVEPTYIRKLPREDPWGGSYSYSVSADHQQYRFASGGADRHLDFASSHVAPVAPGTPPRRTTNPDDDIVYQDGSFVQEPASEENE